MPRLPIGPELETNDVRSEPAPHAVRSGLKILVADDNRDVADTCASLLELSGHLNGYELAERIRAAVWGKGALLVAISGWGREEDRSSAFAAGFRPPPHEAHHGNRTGAAS